MRTIARGDAVNLGRAKGMIVAVLTSYLEDKYYDDLRMMKDDPFDTAWVSRNSVAEVPPSPHGPDADFPELDLMARTNETSRFDT
jgi:hypothetical protein